LYAQARYEEASSVFGFLVSRNSLERRFVFALAACFQMLGQHTLAIQNYLVAAALDPDDPVAIFQSCECLIALGRVAEAREGLAMVSERCLPVRHDAVRKKTQGLMALMDQFSKSEKPGRTQ
jgi:type III secretion system low calcium response chaperone LcrH/SycD